MTGGSGKMQNYWTKDDVAAAWQRFERDRKSTRLNSSHNVISRMPSSA